MSGSNLPLLAPDGSAEQLYQLGLLGVLTVFAILSLLALLLLTVALMPNLSGRASITYGTRHLVCFLLGIGVTVVALLLFGISHAIPGVAVIVLALLAPLSLLALASVSENLGRRLCVLGGREGSRPVHLLLGWLVLASAMLVPFLGWFVILPYALVSGMGSVLLGVFAREEP